MEKNNEQYGNTSNNMENTWKTHGKHMEKYGKHMEQYGKHMDKNGKHMVSGSDFPPTPTRPLLLSWAPHLGLGRLVGPDCGVLVGLGDLVEKPLENHHHPSKDLLITRENHDTMGYDEIQWDIMDNHDLTGDNHDIMRYNQHK